MESKTITMTNTSGTRYNIKHKEGSPCPFCGDGTLNRGFNDVEYQYKGHTLLIQQPGTYCDLCHESILEPSDLKSNRRDLQAFKSRVDGLKMKAKKEKSDV